MTRKMYKPVGAPGTWVEQAACSKFVAQGHNYWFAEKDAFAVERAKTICMGCPVLAECRKAGEKETFGIWGGITPQDRAWKDLQRLASKKDSARDGQGAKLHCEDCWREIHKASHVVEHPDGAKICVSCAYKRRCVSCGQLMRKRAVSKWDAPGTVVYGAQGLCKRCYGARLRAGEPT